MLVLTRKKGESILIGDNIEIVITEVNGDQIKLGINAPKNLQIIRKELFEDIKQANQLALEQQDNILLSIKNLKNK